MELVPYSVPYQIKDSIVDGRIEGGWAENVLWTSRLLCDASSSNALTDTVHSGEK